MTFRARVSRALATCLQSELAGLGKNPTCLWPCSDPHLETALPGMGCCGVQDTPTEQPAWVAMRLPAPLQCAAKRPRSSMLQRGKCVNSASACNEMCMKYPGPALNDKSDGRPRECRTGHSRAEQHWRQRQVPPSCLTADVLESVRLIGSPSILGLDDDGPELSGQTH